MDKLSSKRSRSPDGAQPEGYDAADVSAPSAKRTSLCAGRRGVGWDRHFSGDTRRQTGPDFNEEISSLRTLGSTPSFPPTRFVGGAAPPKLAEPSYFGEFSLDSQRRFFNDAGSRRFYTEDTGVPSQRPQNFDLSKGYANFRQRDDNENEFLDFFLRWIVENGVDLRGIDFACWSGTLSKVMKSPYETHEGWLIAATKFRGTWFLYRYETEAQKSAKKLANAKLKEMQYWGVKFEQYVTSPVKDGRPDVEAAVNNFEGYWRVAKTNLDDHSVIMAGEVDCVDGSDSRSPPRCIELKTAKDYFGNQRWKENFIRYKVLKSWAQSVLLGTPTIVYGLRDDGGVVRRLETLPTSLDPRVKFAIPGTTAFVCDSSTSFWVSSNATSRLPIPKTSYYSPSSRKETSPFGNARPAPIMSSYPNGF